MTPDTQNPTTPLRRAIVAGVLATAMTLAFRVLMSLDDPTKLYSPAPLGAGVMVGLVVYFTKTENKRALSTLFITLGAGGLLLYSALIAFRLWGDRRSDWPVLAIILAIPVIVLVQGILMRRALATPPSAP